MSANSRNYEDYLEYFPKKEREEIEEALFTEENPESVAMAIIKHSNRDTLESRRLQKGRRNLLKQY